MSPARPEPSEKTRTCEQCGALNGAGFDRCIRCGGALGALAVSADGLRARFDGRSLLATKVIVVATLLVFAGQMADSLAKDMGVGIMSIGDAASAVHFGALVVSVPIVAHEPFRLLSAVFVHFGLLHVGMNLLALVNLARISEPGIGSARFTIAYVTTGIASFLTTVIYSGLTADRVSLTAGASGAVFGIMGVILGFLLRRRDPRWKSFAMQAVVMSLMFGFMVNSASTGIMINNSAHIGGLVSGIVLGALFGGTGRRSELWANSLALVALGLCAASLLLARASELFLSI